MATGRLLISCRACLRVVALVPRINDAALAVLETHLRCLHRDRALVEQPNPKETLRHFRVASAATSPYPAATRGRLAH